MENQEAPRSIRDHISIQQVGMETLLYDERRHKAFCLNESSSVIWRLANGKHTIAEMSAAASLQLDIAVSEEFVLFALEELHRDGLIESFCTGKSPSAISRRDVLQKLGVGGAMLLPIVAAIVAPTAAQAYSGCVDCSGVQPSRARRRQGAAVPPK